VAELARAFGLGDVSSCRPLGKGHIHRTFLADCSDGAFVLQRLNSAVFPDLDALLANTQRVTDHLRARLVAAGTADVERRVLRLLRTSDGALSHRDTRGGVWRCTPHIGGSESRGRAGGPEDARAAARAFGAFARALDGLEPAPAITLPGFHDLAGRRAQLEAAIGADALGRERETREDAIRVLQLCDHLLSEHDLAGLPVRVVHNDCKLDNLLFDAKSGEALCVLDLDTVMEGSLVYDFGELVRTASCAAGEDEPDLSKICVDRALLSALTTGYVEGAAELVTDSERRALPLAGARLALENALRFLADHLAGDVYFRIERPGQNLDRHRAQRCLTERLLSETDVVAAQLGLRSAS
jgi:Ser/Thr protein kinase RdoA (MazF antagonist)